ncbi:MAG: hypothetical protein KGN76_12470 [Acidobacteriota bacterium]|nr:hypothetical protein [Acidobacteriota bacterium]
MYPQLFRPAARLLSVFLVAAAVIAFTACVQLPQSPDSTGSTQLAASSSSSGEQGEPAEPSEPSEPEPEPSPSPSPTPAPTPTPTPTPAPTPSPTPSPTTGLTYTANIQPILAASCVVCHNPSHANAGYDLSSYAGVMKAVTPGSANSILILVTQPGGLMYGQFISNAQQNATTIYDWIVNNNAAQ